MRAGVRIARSAGNGAKRVTDRPTLVKRVGEPGVDLAAVGPCLRRAADLQIDRAACCV